MRDWGHAPPPAGRGEPAGWRWRHACALVQRQLAAALARAQQEARLDRAAYLRWVAMEAVLAGANAEALEACACDLQLPRHVRATLVAWQRMQRELEHLAQADLRRAGLGAPADARIAGAWKRVLAPTGLRACGEIAGVAAAHAGAVQGEARDAMDRLAGLDFVAVRISTCLMRRRDAWREVEVDCSALLDTLAPAMAAGAERAARTYSALCESVLSASPLFAAGDPRPRARTVAAEDEKPRIPSPVDGLPFPASRHPPGRIGDGTQTAPAPLNHNEPQEQGTSR